MSDHLEWYENLQADRIRQQITNALCSLDSAIGAIDRAEQIVAESEMDGKKKTRGRPKGSKNKPK